MTEIALSREEVATIDDAPARGNGGGRLGRSLVGQEPLQRKMHPQCDDRHRDPARRRRHPPAHEPDADCKQGRNNRLAGVAGKVVDAERGPDPFAPICTTHQARCERVLHARADSGHQHCDEQGAEPVRLGKQQPADRGSQRAEREQPAFAEALRDQPGGDLADGHRGVEQALQGAGLGKRQPERLDPQRQKDEQCVGQTVVGRVSGGARCEDGTSRAAMRGGHCRARGYRVTAAAAMAIGPRFR